MATHSSIHAWKIPRAEESGGLQSMGSQRVGHGRATSLHFTLLHKLQLSGFLGSSAGKESPCKAGDPGSIPEWGRSPGEGTGYPFQYSWASLVAQAVRNPPAGWETWDDHWVGKISWRREWLPTLVFWHGEFHGV